MLYVVPNFKTKKALKEAVAKGEEVVVVNAEPLLHEDCTNGRFAATGPHYPEPHKWYAEIIVENGRVVKVF